MDCSPPGSFVHGVSQARTLEWVTLSYSSVSSWPRGRTRVSCKTPALQADSLALSHHLIIRVLPSWPHLDLLLLLLLSHYSRVRLCTTAQTAAHQAPPSMGFSRQEYWSGVPLPSPIFCIKCAKWNPRKAVSGSSWLEVQGQSSESLGVESDVNVGWRGREKWPQ